MRRQEFRWLLPFLSASVIAAACAGEQKEDNGFSGGATTGNGGSSGKGGATAGKGGTTAGKGGSSSNAGTTGEGGDGATAGNATAGTGGSNGGTGGSNGGAAGSNGGSAAAAGSANVGDCDVGGAGFGDGVLRVEFDANSADPTQQPGGNFEIINDTGSAIPESEFSLRYYLTSEFPCDDADETIVSVYDFRRQNPHDDSPGTGDVVKNVVVLGDNGSGCDIYIEFVVTIDLAAGQYATLNFGTMPPHNDYNSHPTNQSNDASFGACTTMFVPWAATPLYLDGVLTWGEEPDGGGAGGAGGAGGDGAGGAAGNNAGAGGA